MSRKKTSGHSVVTYPKEQLLLKHASNISWAKNQISWITHQATIWKSKLYILRLFCFYYFVCLLYVCARVHTHHSTHVEVRVNFQELVLPPPTEPSHRFHFIYFLLTEGKQEEDHLPSSLLSSSFM